MGITERRQRQKEEVRSNILHSAWQIVEQEGWQALSIRKIADAIEYSIPVIYSHFASKDAILLEFIKEGFHRLSQQLGQANRKHTDPYQQLEAMAQAYWDFAFTSKEYYQVMFGLGIPACEMVNQVEEMQTFSNTILESLKQAIAISSQPQTDHWLKFHTYWSILHGLVSIQLIDNHERHNLTRQMILQDAIAGFIYALKG
ncbi:TetR/AcrR family transcriptional regulator [Spirosoma sp. SC4-14]|uniref:TetR/AcrR family transcriptional regulator n=1 Tax=Spirosoma sp. SC4-14 TaxID=3128900 RepID=UPI0030CEF22F